MIEIAFARLHYSVWILRGFVSVGKSMQIQRISWHDVLESRVTRESRVARTRAKAKERERGRGRGGGQSEKQWQKDCKRRGYKVTYITFPVYGPIRS